MKNTQIDHFLFPFVHTILTNQETTLLNGQKDEGISFHFRPFGDLIPKVLSWAVLTSTQIARGADFIQKISSTGAQ